ncbi:MAG: hypothetical protein AAF613_10070 [Pseudomonadota bacterium]
MMKPIAALAALSAISLPVAADGLAPPPTAVYTPSDTSYCAPFTTQIYFQRGETVLSQHALNAIQAASDRAAGCAVAKVELVSLAADEAETEGNALLAADRLVLVQELMDANGVTSDQFSAEIVTASLADPIEPMARRVEVMIAAYQPEIG